MRAMMLPRCSPLAVADPTWREFEVDLKGIVDRAKGIFDKRGGTEAAKADATELRDIAQSDQSKATDAVEAVKEPGAN
jgi:hypothetical protein